MIVCYTLPDRSPDVPLSRQRVPERFSRCSQEKIRPFL